MAVKTQSKEEVAQTDPASVFIQLLDRATPQQQDIIKRKLGIRDNSIKVKQSKQRRLNNERARQVVATSGEVIHADPNFRPTPPERVVSKGEMAVQLWLERWDQGQNMSSRDLADAEALAEEAQVHTAEMERRADAGEFAETGI